MDALVEQSIRPARARSVGSERRLASAARRPSSNTHVLEAAMKSKSLATSETDVATVLFASTVA
jgi:hypothetical protein